MGCSTVAVNGLRRQAGAHLLFRILPANREKTREPTSGLEPLTCSLRVIHHVLQGFARACNYRILRPVSLLWVA
jgi:hypothetical protein